MKKDKIINIIRTIMLIAGVCILLYPTVSNYLYEKNSTKLINEYDEKAVLKSSLDRKLELNEARIYNLNIQDSWEIYDPFKQKISGEDKVYLSKLNNGNNMMGYIEIPKIDVKLPIYHGIDERVLQNGVGHMHGTSLPIGGKNTHSVLTGHRGLPSKLLFTDLNQLEIGDRFYITVLDQKLAYMVENIKTVLPEETDSLKLHPKRDYCTLITCTPYSINSHRLLVRGTRVPYDREEFENEKGISISKLLFSLIVLLFVVILLIIYLIKRRRRR